MCIFSTALICGPWTHCPTGCFASELRAFLETHGGALHALERVHDLTEVPHHSLCLVHARPSRPRQLDHKPCTISPNCPVPSKCWRRFSTAPSRSLSASRSAVARDPLTTAGSLQCALTSVRGRPNRPRGRAQRRFCACKHRVQEPASLGAVNDAQRACPKRRNLGRRRRVLFYTGMLWSAHGCRGRRECLCVSAPTHDHVRVST